MVKIHPEPGMSRTLTIPLFASTLRRQMDSPSPRPHLPRCYRPLVARAAAIASTRLALETMPSLAPSTAARNQPTRSVRCRSP